MPRRSPVGRLRRQLRLAQHETMMFRQLMDGMLSQLPLRGMFKLIVRAVVEGLGYDRAGIFLLANDRKTLEHSMGIDEKGRFEWGKYPFPVSKKRGFSIFSDIANGHLDFFFTNNIRKKLDRARVSCGVTCNANVPLRVGKDRIIGVLAVDNLFTQRRLKKRNIHSLQYFATQAGMAIESHRMHVTLRHDVKELRRLSRVKDDFLSVVSHELRTPLTSIIGYLKLLLQKAVGPMSEDQQDMIETAHRNAVRLFQIVNNLLDLSRFQAGFQDMQKGSVDPVEVLSNAVQTLRTQAAVRGLILETEPAPSVEPIEADAPKLESVLVNLLSNAVKYTPEGGRIKVACIGTCVGGKDGVEFTVSDTGVGIPRKHLKKIFDAFYQVENHMTRNVGGTGLGLAIAKKIVEAHDGRISVESEPGKGSTFKVFLPRKGPVTGKPTDPGKAAKGSGE